jgi:hypothetical protein
MWRNIVRLVQYKGREKWNNMTERRNLETTRNKGMISEGKMPLTCMFRVRKPTKIVEIFGK